MPVSKLGEATVRSCLNFCNLILYYICFKTVKMWAGPQDTTRQNWLRYIHQAAAKSDTYSIDFYKIKTSTSNSTAKLPVTKLESLTSEIMGWATIGNCVHWYYPKLLCHCVMQPYVGFSKLFKGKLKAFKTGQDSSGSYYLVPNL